MNRKIPKIDLYRLLGIEPTATPEEIKSAFKKQIFRFHPDKADPHLIKDAEEITKQLYEAREWLSNPTMRSIYDSQYKGMENPQHSAVDEFNRVYRPCGLTDTSGRTIDTYV